MRNIGTIQVLDEQKIPKIFSIYIYVVVILSTVLGGIISGQGTMDILRNVIISIIGIVTYLVYFQKNNSSMLFRMNNIRGYCVAFALSNILLAINCGVFTGFVWLIGIAFAAIFDGIEHAAVTYGIIMLQYMLLILMSDRNINMFILSAVIGVVLIILFTQIEDTKTIPYASVVLIILTAILFIALNEFDIKKISHHMQEIIMLFISDAVFILFAFLSCVYKKNQKNAEEQYKKLLQKKLMNILEADYELIKKLHEYSAPLFVHSMKVSMLSRDAAESIGADMFLAQAGGMYHEVGRIRNEKDYIKAGIELAYSYGFPEELISVIRQHSTGSEKPKSVEAAIVMLSDCIISTSEYLEKTGDRKAVSDEKLIESIFNNRIEKGNLTDVDITDEEIEALKKYYIENAFVS